MDIKGKRLLLIGGAGLIGSHTADELLKEDIKELIIYDNFCRGSEENLGNALKDSRCKIFKAGGDILQTDILNNALKGINGVFHFAALWLLQCYEYPRSAFEVNIKGTFNVLEACVKNNITRLVFSSSASVYGDALQEPMTEEHPYNNTNFYGATKIADEHMCRAFYHRYKLPYVGLRYMNVYGPRQDYKGIYIAVIMKIPGKRTRFVEYDTVAADDFSFGSNYEITGVVRHPEVFRIGSFKIQANKSGAGFLVPIRFFDMFAAIVPVGNRTGITDRAVLTFPVDVHAVSHICVWIIGSFRPDNHWRGPDIKIEIPIDGGQLQPVAGAGQLAITAVAGPGAA